MEEPEEIVKILNRFFQKKKSFKNKRILISAGPTCEAIDPVRFIANHSSGKMGYALAYEMAERGAEVFLVSGPVSQQINHVNISVLPVVSAKEMYDACNSLFGQVDVAIMAAAVADYRPESIATNKIKKKEAVLQITLEKTDDILKSLGAIKEKQFLLGFALETENEQENAQKKMLAKNCDALVLNSMNDNGAGFGYETNKVMIMGGSHKPIEYDLKPKTEVARDICDYIEKNIKGKGE